MERRDAHVRGQEDNMHGAWGPAASGSVLRQERNSFDGSTVGLRPRSTRMVRNEAGESRQDHDVKGLGVPWNLHVC